MIVQFLLIGMMALAACGGPRKNQSESEPMKKTTFEHIEAICASLSGAAPDAVELAKTVGNVDETGRSAVYVTPSFDGFKTVIISRDRATGHANYIEITLKAPDPTLLNQLIGAHGDPTRETQLHHDGAVRMRFDANKRRRCVVRASVAKDDVSVVVAVAVEPAGS